MHPPTFVVVPLLLLTPFSALVGQQPRGVLVPVGARVKVEAPGKTIKGILLPWRGDTLVLIAEEPVDMYGDTVRLAGASLKSFRVVQSPSVWRYSTSTDINFYVDVAVPRPSDSQLAGADQFRHVLLVASKGELAGVDPATGTATWTRTDLPDLKGVALDVVGRTGYAVITRGEKMEIIDLRTGERRWDTGELSLRAARGWLPLPSEDLLILMYGRTAESASTLMAVELETGKVRWRQDRLFAVEPKVFGTAGVSYLLGHQPPLADSDTTLVLYLSTEGPMRLDARTGALLWRAATVRDAKVPAVRDGYARIRLHRDVLLVPSTSDLVALRALRATDGRLAWETPRASKEQIVRMERTRHGLLVRADQARRDLLGLPDPTGRVDSRIDLLDPDSGKSHWRAPVQLKNATGIALRGDTGYVVSDGKVLALRIPDGSVRTVMPVKFDQNEGLSGFGVLDEGIVLNSWHHLVLADREGAERYRRSYPSPGESFGEAIRTNTERPTTRWGGGDVFFFTGAPDEAGRLGFSVVKVNPRSGREAGRVWLDERSPAYRLEPASSAIYYRPNARAIVALTFGDWDALAHAARSGHAATVEKLLQMGVDARTTGDGGWTPLHLAARGGHAEVVRLLLARGVDLEAKTEGGWSAWMMAEGEGHAAVAQMLRDTGAHADSATASLLRVWQLSRQGRIEEALVAYAETQTGDSALAVAPSAWMALCWNGSLSGHATEVMPACEKAVERTAPSDQYYAAVRSARGLARALTGDLEGAAADLEPSVDPDEDEEDAGPVRQWVDALRNGRNPFTPAVLESLSRR